MDVRLQMKMNCLKQQVYVETECENSSLDHSDVF